MHPSAMAWVLWDFAAFQIAFNRYTCEPPRVYGEGACFQDGPFSLTWDDEFPGRAILVGMDRGATPSGPCTS